MAAVSGKVQRWQSWPALFGLALQVGMHLEALKLLHNWARLAQDRDSWRESIQELLGHTQHDAGNV